MSHSNYIKVGSYIYSDTEQIGKGSFGKVYKGKSLATGGPVAIKVMQVESNKQAQRIKMIKAEVEALKRSKSEYIIKFFDFIVQNNTVYIVTEYCNQKDLRHYLSAHKVLEEKKAIELLKQIVLAFKDLCRSQVLHRDLKPANILLHNGVCKIADFGFAKTLDFSVTDYNTQMVSIVGTPLYMSPQLLDKQKYTTKSDIWSLGIIFYEMLFGKVPWVGKDPASYSKNIKSIPLSFDPAINNISAESQDFLIHCLKVLEEDRFGWTELFEHPLVSDDDQLSKSTKDDSTEAEETRGVMPAKMIQGYVKMPIKPSTLVKQYQGKALEKSRDMTNFNMELTKTTIDQKIKNINQLILSQSLVPGGKNPISKVITNSFNEDAKNIDTLLNTNHLKSHVLKESKDLSISPVSARKLSPKMSDEAHEEFKKIELPLIVMKNKLNVLNDLFKIVYKNEDFKEIQILKFSFLIAIAKLINMIFKVLSGQVLTKKVKTRSHLLSDYLESDGFKSLVVFVETNKKQYDEMLKNCSRKLFELNLSSDKEKDEVLEFYHEIYNEVEEQTLLGKMVDMANQMLYQIRFNSQIYSKKGGSASQKNPDAEVSKEYLEGVLALFGDDTMLDNFKYDKMEEVIVKMKELQREAVKEREIAQREAQRGSPKRRSHMK